jgi:hypothetical protein
MNSDAHPPTSKSYCRRYAAIMPAYWCRRRRLPEELCSEPAHSRIRCRTHWHALASREGTGRKNPASHIGERRWRRIVRSGKVRTPRTHRPGCGAGDVEHSTRLPGNWRTTSGSSRLNRFQRRGLNAQRHRCSAPLRLQRLLDWSSFVRWSHQTLFASHWSSLGGWDSRS